MGLWNCRYQLWTGDWLYRNFATKKRRTYLPIIQSVARPGSIIHSDKWRAYRGIQGMEFAHKRVNHSAYFVEPDGTHTQTMESCWSRKKTLIESLDADEFPCKFICKNPSPEIDFAREQEDYFAYDQFFFSTNQNWPMSVISLFNVWILF